MTAVRNNLDATLRGVLAALALAALVAGAGRTGAAPPAPAVALEDGLSVELRSGREIVLRVAPLPGEGWRAMARRLCAPTVGWQELRAGALGGGGNDRDPQRDETYPVAFALLTEELKVRALRALFPGDGFDGEEWVHRPGDSPVETFGEGVWQVAEWFTGAGENFTALGRTGGSDPALRAEEEVRIPAPLLRPGLRRLAPPPGAARAAADGEAAAVPRPAANGLLTYGRDAEGRYALYRLKAGEALYSAVVVRFTGRLDPDEVNRAAATIAKASGIRDVTDIPIGYAVRIPMDLLLPEFLPPDDPRRQEYERAQAEAARYRNPARARNLQGVHVILDAGHGGVDHGAITNGVHEHEYVYDVMCRVKRILETETGATVYPVIADRKSGFAPRDSRTLDWNGAEEILTDPPHPNDDRSRTAMGVNLRWYLANSIHRRLVRKGVPADRIVFISIHADSLHPSLRGGMVYIPGERYRRGTFGSNSPAYRNYREVREKPRVSFSRRESLQSEGVSRELAGHIVDAMKERGLPVHPFMPVRDRIIRGRRAWVPAVLRANEVPAKVLVEIANINNPHDARAVKDPRFRDRVAEVLVEGLRRFYPPP